MGLDGVELIMEVENTFGIRIPDTEAEQLLTVGDLQEAVLKRVQVGQVAPSYEQVVFFRLRHLLRHYARAAPILTTTDLHELVPLAERRVWVAASATATGWSLPQLDWSPQGRRLADVFDWILFVGSIAWLVLAWWQEIAWWQVVLVLVGVVTMRSLIRRTLAGWRRYFVPHQLGAYVQVVVASNRRHFVQQFGGSRQQIIALVNQIIIDKIGVDEAEVVPGARFTDDLGVD